MAIEESIEVKKTVLNDDSFLRTIEEIVKVVTAAYKNRDKIYFCGNGGSAADAQHLAAEFTGRFYLNRLALPAEAMHCNTSYLTAVGNDYGFDEVYARMIRGIANKGDILIGLSTSGNSLNIVKAFEVARQKSMVTIGFTGASGGDMRPFCDYLLNVPSSNTPRIQETHIVLGHIICQNVEEMYFSDDDQLQWHLK